MRDILSLVSSQSPSNAREKHLRPLKRPLTAGDAEAPAKVHPSQRYTNSRGADRGTDQAGRDVRTARPTKATTETRAAKQAGRGTRAVRRTKAAADQAERDIRATRHTKALTEARAAEQAGRDAATLLRPLGSLRQLRLCCERRCAVRPRAPSP